MLSKGLESSNTFMCVNCCRDKIGLIAWSCVSITIGRAQALELSAICSGFIPLFFLSLINSLFSACCKGVRSLVMIISGKCCGAFLGMNFALSIRNLRFVLSSRIIFNGLVADLGLPRW